MPTPRSGSHPAGCFFFKRKNTPLIEGCFWSRFWDLNPGPLLYESIALPAELKRPMLERGTGLEPATLCLGSKCSTTELPPHLDNRAIYNMRKHRRLAIMMIKFDPFS